VLVVDDNAQNRAVAEAMLRDEGYHVVLAVGGEEGVAAFERERPDCVLLDVRMPGVDGFTACKCMRARRSTPCSGSLSCCVGAASSRSMKKSGR
jgi:two-component system, sensor histidine kinase and response regulator